MGRKIDVDQLVGTYEIAKRLGLRSQNVVHDWRRRHADFPEPVARLRGSLIWSWPDVRAWARRTGRL